MALTKAQLEDRLGPPADFVVSENNRWMLKQWAIASGRNPVDVNVMTSVELANLYHASAGKSKEGVSLELAADMFVKIVQAAGLPGFNVSLMQQIATDKWEQNFSDIGAEIQKRIEALPPRVIEIRTQSAPAVQLNGPLHYKTETCIRSAARGDHIMMVGPAGCGKTTIGNHVAAALQLPFYITSTITDTHQLTGYVDGYGKYHSTPFRSAFEFGGVWVADEIDAWDAAALLAANSALANGYANFPDRDAPIGRHASFRMVATANTFGNGADRIYIGRNELDAASLDRFALITVDYDLELERLFANGNQKWLSHVWQLREKVTAKKIRHVVSSRAIAIGARALADGEKWNDVCEMYLYKSLSATDRAKCDI